MNKRSTTFSMATICILLMTVTGCTKSSSEVPKKPTVEITQSQTGDVSSVSYQMETTKISLPNYRYGQCIDASCTGSKETYINQPVYMSPDGRRIGFVIYDPSGATVVIRDKEHEIFRTTYDGAIISEIAFSHGGEHFGYTVEQLPRYFAVIDGKEEASIKRAASDVKKISD